MIVVSGGIRRFVFAAVAVGGVVASASAFAQGAPTTALTATEQAAVAQMLNQVNALSGAALQGEVARLAKQYADQNLNLTGIVKAVKTAAGNKLGAVNIAMASACGGSAAGSAASAAICQAAVVAPDQAPGPGRTNVADTGGVAGIETAGIGGGAGGGAGGATGFTGAGAGAGTGTGTGAGSGTSAATTGSLTSGSGGSQTYTSYSASVSRSTGSVGTSVSAR